MDQTFKMNSGKPEIIEGASGASDETRWFLDYDKRFLEMAMGSKEGGLGRSHAKESNLGKAISTLNSVFLSNKNTSQQYPDTGESGETYDEEARTGCW